MTVLTRRLLPLACTLWILAVFAASPNARETSRSREQNPHPDLSLFTHSDNCLACHNTLLSPDGEDVSIGATWRSTMMANSARDPYWQAGVRRETIDHPKRSADIQNECSACHMPMAQKIAHAAGGKGEVFTHLPIAGPDGSELQRLASDGISCTVCHQIAPDRLGTRESFNANFIAPPHPRRRHSHIFGPYQVDRGRQSIMRSVTGFVQSEATHIKQSELCASCHTLITEAFGPNGEVIGSLPEQMNYQEWQHSAFRTEERSCQSCHMPRVAGPVRASSVLGAARDEMAQHVFVGGNAFMVRMLNRYRNELGVAALPSELDATARATIRQLQDETATLRSHRSRSTGGNWSSASMCAISPAISSPPAILRAVPGCTSRFEAVTRWSSSLAPLTAPARFEATTTTLIPGDTSLTTSRLPSPIRSRSTSLSSEIAPERRRQDS